MNVDKLFVATKALIVKDGKVLMLREKTSTDGTQTGKYSTVGGRVQPGERFDEGLMREVKEECGLDIQIGQPLFVQEWRPNVRDEQWQIVAIFFICEPASDDVVLGDEHDHHKWIDPQNYKNEGLIENLFPVFEAFNAQ